MQRLHLTCHFARLFVINRMNDVEEWRSSYFSHRTCRAILTPPPAVLEHSSGKHALIIRLSLLVHIYDNIINEIMIKCLLIIVMRECDSTACVRW